MLAQTEALRAACASLAVVAACSSGAPAVEHAQPPHASAPSDAAIDAPPDAGLSPELTAAPPWVFRYATKDRTETWTLRFAGGAAVIDVESARGTMRYLGSATETTSIAVDVSTATAKMKLDCKRAKRPLSAKCNDTKAKPVLVLDCYHPDFKAPMPFAAAPGVEYVVDEKCNGYRLISG